MAMDFASAGARVRSLIAAKRPKQELSTSALTRDVLRDNVIEEAIGQSPRFQALADSTPQVEYDAEQPDGSQRRESFKWDQFGEAVRDVARAAYTWREPDLQAPGEMRPSHRLNREIVAQTLLSPEFRDGRPYTIENAPESLMGARQFADAMIEHAPELAEHIARSEQMRDAEDQIDEAQQMIDDIRAMAQQPDEIWGADPTDPNVVQAMKDQIAKRQAAREQLQQLADEHQASGAAGAARKVARAAAKAFGEGVETASVIAGLPGMEPGSAHNRTLGQQLELAEKLSNMERLMRIAKAVGRRRLDMRAKRQARSRNVKIEPVGITTGNDLTQLLPHELARMGVPQLRPLWLRDWSNHALLQWQMGGKAPLSKGPAVVVFDGSGSMSGQRIDFAVSTALATLGQLHSEKRDFAAVQFGSRSRGASGKSELKSWFFPASADPDPNQVIDLATHFFAGGTSIGLGLEEALRIIQSVPAFSEADVVLITDGEDNFREADAEIVAKLRKLHVRIHGITVGHDAQGSRYMRQACEYVVHLADVLIDEPNAATDALAENIT